MTKKEWYKHLTDESITSGDLKLTFMVPEPGINLAELIIETGVNQIMTTDYLLTDEMEIQIKILNQNRILLFKENDFGIKVESLGKYLFIQKKDFETLIANGLLEVVML